ncbi:alpha/beta hydrolase [Pseudogracilibacillus sp. SE30717A]|uniref:alpha/beta fold hydrolase n=1 Tax=Pseudogracilibacillus sp. SE30717A TaxID=3098293 RepID=UPI00300E21CA
MEREIVLFSVDEVVIEYSIIGKGDPILVFHGGHSNCREELGYKTLIENGFSIITPTRPGYGNTSKEIGLSLSEACHYYIQLIKHLKLEKVHVLAISAGGPTGIYFAAHYPEYVRSLTLQSAVTKEWLTPKDKEYKAAKILFHPLTEKYTWRMVSMFGNVLPTFIFKQMFSSFSTISYKEAKEKIDTQDVEAFRRMINRQQSGSGFLIDLKLINELTIADLNKVSCPTIIMHSNNDGSVPIQHAHFAHQHIKKSELCFLNTWGHLIWLGKSANEFNQHLLNFLSTHSVKD